MGEKKKKDKKDDKKDKKDKKKSEDAKKDKKDSKKKKKDDEDVKKSSKKDKKDSKKDKKKDDKKDKKAKENKKKDDKKDKKDSKKDKKEKKDKKDSKKDKKEKSSEKDKKKGGKDDKKKSDKGDKKKSKKTDVVETICCICKDSGADASAGGLCNHVFCISCLESLLHKPMKDPTPNDNQLAAPTLGRCPECDAELRKFEMKDTKNTKELLMKRDTDIKASPLHGLIFRPVDEDIQLGNFHFDHEEGPYMDFTDAIDKDKDMWLMNDGTEVPEKKFFNDGCHYDKSTRTFHGQITWQPVTFQGAYQWDVVLAFAKDFKTIHVGLIHERKERQLKDDSKEKIDRDDLHRHEYPLDGGWKLIWLNADGNQQTGNITVRNNEFQQGPYLFNLNYDEPEKPRFRWPLDPVYAAAQSGVNLKKTPMGPEVGERIVWETTHPAFKEITWQRETIGDRPLQRTVHFGVSNNEYTSDAGGGGPAEPDNKDDASSASGSGSDSDSDSESEPKAKGKSAKDDDDSSSGSSSASSSESGSDSDSDSGSSSSSGSDSS